MTDATGKIANNYQDFGKSTDEQQELNDQRIKGESTNGVNKWIGKQEESGILGAIDDVEHKNDELTHIINDGMGQADVIADVADHVIEKVSGSKNDGEQNKEGNMALTDGDSGSEPGNAETADDTTPEGITQSYYDANAKANELRNQKASQERELERLKNQLSDTESNVELYCGNGNEDSALCAAAKAERDAIKGSIAITEYQLSETSKQYEEADRAAKEAKEKKLQSDIDASEQKMKEAQKGYEEACNKEASNYSQTACVEATRKYMSAASEYTKSVETKAKNDGTYIEKPSNEVPQEKGVTEQYNDARSATTSAESNLAQIQRDKETTEKNLKEARANAERSCSVDANSQACISAKSIVSTLEAKRDNLESAISGAQAEVDAAEQAEKEAYKNKLEDDLSNAQAMVTVAQAAAKEACERGENYNYDACNKAIDQLINTQANLAKTIAEKDKLERTSVEKPSNEVPQEKGVTEQYNDARSATTSAESNLAQIQRDKETTEKNLKEARANAERSCSVDANSQACISAKSIVSTLEAKRDNLESAISGAQAEVDAAKQAETAAYQNKIEADVSNAQNEVEAAQAAAEEACNSGENYKHDVCNNAMNKLINAQANLAKTIAEKDKFEGTYIDQASYDKKQEDLRNAENSMYQTGDNGESTQNPTEAYEDLQSTVNSLYNQIGSQEKEIERLEKDAANKEKRAKEECAKNENSNACASAKKEVEAAQDKINHKKQEHEETKKRYTEAHSKIESAYQSSLNSEVKGAEAAYNDAVAQREAASKELENANVELSNAQQGVASSRKDAEDAVSAAQAAKSEYEKALAEGKTEEELSKLKKDYEEKLLAMKAAQNKYEESKEYYKKQEQRVKKAKEDYSDSIDNVSRASENWAALTSEQDNQTGESKLFDAESSSNNSVVSSYERENSPAALANASQRSYEESKSALSRAKQDLEQKEKQAERAQKEYEAALKKAQNSNSDADIKEAERLKQKADLAKNEFNMAKTEHDTATADYASKEQDYCEKKIKSEQHKQKEYEEKIKVNESMLNTYKAEAEKRYAEATKAAERFKAAQAALQADDEAGKIEVAKLYEEYKKAKEEYNQYANLYKNTYSELSNTKKQYSDSLNTVKELESLLKKYL